MEEQIPRRSRRVQNLPPIPFEFSPSLRRRRLNTTGSFKPTGSSKFLGEPDSAENMASTPDDTRDGDLEIKGFVRPFNPPLTGAEAPVLV